MNWYRLTFLVVSPLKKNEQSAELFKVPPLVELSFHHEMSQKKEVEL